MIHPAKAHNAHDDAEHPTCPHCGKPTGNETLSNGRVTARVCCVVDIARGCALKKEND